MTAPEPLPCPNLEDVLDSAEAFDPVLPGRVEAARAELAAFRSELERAREWEGLAREARQDVEAMCQGCSESARGKIWLSRFDALSASQPDAEERGAVE